MPAGDKWVHETKWDGYRLQIRIENGKVAILTRRGHNWTDRLPSICDAAKRKRGKLKANVRLAAPSIRVWLSGTSWYRVQFLAFFSTKL